MPAWKCKNRVVHALFFLWLLLANICSPNCTSEVTAPPEGRTAAPEALAGTAGWGFSTFKVSIPNPRGPERAFRPWQLLWWEMQEPHICKPSAEGTLSYSLLTLKIKVPFAANNYLQWSKILFKCPFLLFPYPMHRFKALTSFDFVGYFFKCTYLGSVSRLSLTPLAWYTSHAYISLQRSGERTLVSNHCSLLLAIQPYHGSTGAGKQCPSVAEWF